MKRWDDITYTRDAELPGFHVIREVGEVQAEGTCCCTSGAHSGALRAFMKRVKKLRGNAVVNYRVLIESVGLKDNFKATISGTAISAKKL